MQGWATQTLSEVEEDRAVDIAADIGNFANLIQQFLLGSRADNLEIGIFGYEISLTVFTPEKRREIWATLHNNLGAAYNDRIRGERDENLERAIACYEAALQVYTPEAFPENWAMTQNNLGAAYSSRIRGERDENLERAIACYEAALQVYTPEAFPENWAMTQNNLGAAYSSRIRGERGENLERAIACYEAALQVYTPEAFPEKWAGTQNNLGNAYNNRIRGERGENLERAIACYEAALQVYTPEAFPQNWASTHNNLGTAYTERIRGERAENLERAIAHYEVALAVYTPEVFPEQWASTQNNLGTAYTERIRGERAENLERAIACYAAALQVYTPTAFPQKNAETLFNLGVAYQSRGALEKAYDVFTEAVKTVEQLRLETISSYEAKQKQSEEWNQLYQCLVEVCLELQNYTAALEFVERSKARNLADLLASGKLSNQESIEPIVFREIQELLDEETAILEWYILNDNFVAFIITRASPVPIVWRSSTNDLEDLTNLIGKYLNDYMSNQEEWRSQLPSHLARLAEILHINEIISMLPAQCECLVVVPHRYLHLFPISALPLEHNGTETYFLDLFLKGVQYVPSCQILQIIQGRSRQNFDKLFAIQNPTEDLSFTDIEVEAVSRYFKSHTILARQEATKLSLSSLSEELKSTHCLHISAHSFFDFQSPLLSSILLANSTLPQSVQLESTRGFRFSVRVDSGDSPSKPFSVDLDKCLTLAEIYDMNLSECRLVTLSASDTATVDISSQSDDYISFQGAFLSAEANSVVGSLWSPNDRSTAFLMLKIYANVFQGLPISMALSQAQLWLREVTAKELQDWISDNLDPRVWNATHRLALKRYLQKNPSNEKPFSHPFHWAAFILTGAIEKYNFSEEFESERILQSLVGVSFR
ncbi:CHAT domain-containing protein [Oscillatoria acuminata]